MLHQSANIALLVLTSILSPSLRKISRCCESLTILLPPLLKSWRHATGKYCVSSHKPSTSEVFEYCFYVHAGDSMPGIRTELQLRLLYLCQYTVHPTNSKPSVHKLQQLIATPPIQNIMQHPHPIIGPYQENVINAGFSTIGNSK
jgi:hypothetical protein